MTAHLDTTSRLTRFRRALSPAEWTALGGMASFILLLHFVGFGVLAGIVAPRNYHLSQSGIYGIGLGLTAYLLGMRHAFDADHIAAIDNTTRKLMADGKRPLSVGFWFSLGHSTIVFGLALLLSIGVKALASQVTETKSSALQQNLGLISTSVSGVFLTHRHHQPGHPDRDHHRVPRDAARRLRRTDPRKPAQQPRVHEPLPRRGDQGRHQAMQMYPTGMLFGLGFETATEVSLLVLAGGAAASNLPWYAILILPILFAAGMCLLDTADGCFMNFAYGWAFSKPVRKVYYNITITALSVAVALIVGTIELISILIDKLGIDSGPLALIGNLNLNGVGFFIVGLFVLTWIVALGIWRFGRIEEKWSANLATSPPSAD